MAETAQQILARTIRNLRRRTNKRQEDVADHLHISQPSYSAYERGVTPIPLERLAQICAYLEGDINALMQIFQATPTEADEEEDAESPVLGEPAVSR